MGSSDYRVVDSVTAGYPTTTLVSQPGAIEVTFAPGLGMLGCSLRHHGDELLGQRGGIAKYAATGSTMGIPLLHPWANRLSGLHYAVGTRNVTLNPQSLRLHRDAHGLPMHGLLAGYTGWLATSSADHTGARLAATLDFAADGELLAAFPFAHTLRIDAEVRDTTVTIATTLRATGVVAVPVSFGYHPYLQLPGVPRADWRVTLPVHRRWMLDDRGIPTGVTQAAAIPPGPLGNRTFDALFGELVRPARFSLAGGGRCITVTFDSGYEYAQVYAPSDDAVVCFEPMTAATNALITGGAALPLVQPQHDYRATFALTIDS